MKDRTPPDPTQPPPSKSDTEAIDWLIRLTEMATESDDTRGSRRRVQDEFNVWATRSSANLRSFLEVASMFEALGECETELIQELVSHAGSADGSAPPAPAANQAVVTEVSEPIAPPFKERSKWLRGPSLAIAAMLLVATVGSLSWGWDAEITYRTQPGEWRRIRFEDGSVAILSEQSEVRISFSKTNRRITLPRGQVVFDVAKDPRRPFLVVTPNAEIQALGTRFDVDYRNGPTRVTVAVGSVRVSTASNASQPNLTRTLMEEQGAEVSSRQIVDSSQSQVKSALASQRDVVVFDHDPLSVVADRINLGSRRQLRFANSAAGIKPISGRYKTDHPEELVAAIHSLYPELEIQEMDDGWVMKEPTTGGRAK